MAETTSFCEQCGAALPEGIAFCESCGAAVPRDVAPPAPEPAATTGAEPEPTPAPTPEPAATTGAPSRRFAWQPIAIGLLGVLVIVVAIVSAL